MQINQDLISFFTGAAIIHVPLTINATVGNDLMLEIAVYIIKSVIGGIVSVGVAHLINRKTKEPKVNQNP